MSASCVRWRFCKGLDAYCKIPSPQELSFHHLLQKTLLKKSWLWKFITPTRRWQTSSKTLGVLTNHFFMVDVTQRFWCSCCCCDSASCWFAMFNVCGSRKTCQQVLVRMLAKQGLELMLVWCWAQWKSPRPFQQDIWLHTIGFVTT